MWSKSVTDAYRELKKAYPGEVAVFCCDLGSAWLFKFIPEKEVGNSHYISGYLGVAVSKDNGRVYQYDMLNNMESILNKKNIAKELR